MKCVFKSLKHSFYSDRTVGRATDESVPRKAWSRDGDEKQSNYQMQG